MPPMPVAAPWYGSTYDGWLCDSTLKVTARPSPTSTTPAFSPMPTSIRSPLGIWPNCRRCTLELLYEQCSLHMIEYIASSELVGRRPRISTMRAYSSSLSPSSAYGIGAFGSASAATTVSINARAP